MDNVIHLTNLKSAVRAYVLKRTEVLNNLTTCKQAKIVSSIIDAAIEEIVAKFARQGLVTIGNLLGVYVSGNKVKTRRVPALMESIGAKGNIDRAPVTPVTVRAKVSSRLNMNHGVIQMILDRFFLEIAINLSWGKDVKINGLGLFTHRQSKGYIRKHIQFGVDKGSKYFEPVDYVYFKPTTNFRKARLAFFEDKK